MKSEYSEQYKELLEGKSNINLIETLKDLIDQFENLLNKPCADEAEKVTNKKEVFEKAQQIFDFVLSYQANTVSIKSIVLLDPRFEERLMLLRDAIMCFKKSEGEKSILCRLELFFAVIDESDNSRRIITQNIHPKLGSIMSIAIREGSKYAVVELLSRSSKKADVVAELLSRESEEANYIVKLLSKDSEKMNSIASILSANTEEANYTAKILSLNTEETKAIAKILSANTEEPTISVSYLEEALTSLESHRSDQNLEDLNERYNILKMIAKFIKPESLNENLMERLLKIGSPLPQAINDMREELKDKKDESLVKVISNYSEFKISPNNAYEKWQNRLIGKAFLDLQQDQVSDLIKIFDLIEALNSDNSELISIFLPKMSQSLVAVKKEWLVDMALRVGDIDIMISVFRRIYSLQKDLEGLDELLENSEFAKGLIKNIDTFEFSKENRELCENKIKKVLKKFQISQCKTQSQQKKETILVEGETMVVVEDAPLEASSTFKPKNYNYVKVTSRLGLRKNQQPQIG